MRVQLPVDGVAALVVLLGATVLAVVTPRGVTRFARRPAIGQTGVRLSLDPPRRHLRF